MTYRQMIYALAGTLSAVNPAFAADAGQSPASVALSPKAAPILACGQGGVTPVLNCPARNELLWAHPNTQNLVRKLVRKGVFNSGGGLSMSSVIYTFAGVALITGTALTVGGHNSVSP